VFNPVLFSINFLDDSTDVQPGRGSCMEIQPSQTKDFLRMDLSESRYPPSPKVIRILQSAAKKVNEYPDSASLNVRRALAEYCLLKPENIIAGNGSDEIIDLITRTFVKEGDEIIEFTPTFSQYEWSANILNARTIKIPSFTDDGYVIKSEWILDRLSERTKIIWVCNPNNPTGNTIPQECVNEILETVDKNVKVVVDECYYEFSKQTCLGFLDKYENLILVRSLSKTFCIAGLRLGYAVSNTETISSVKSFKQPFNVNLMAQIAGTAVLEDLGYYKTLWSKLTHERDMFVKMLKKIKKLRIFPSETNFLLLDVRDCSKNPREIYQSLIEKKISALPGWSPEFSGLSDSFLRVLVSTREENTRFATELSKIISRIGVRRHDS
jgi:histidinol-phosphate aminotransferase